MTDASSQATIPADELEAGTEKLLAASQRGTVPEISFVRSSADQTGLVVAVPKRVLADYGPRERLAVIYSDEVDLPVEIEVAEAPQDLLPTMPSTAG